MIIHVSKHDKPFLFRRGSSKTYDAEETLNSKRPAKENSVEAGAWSFDAGGSQYDRSSNAAIGPPATPVNPVLFRLTSQFFKSGDEYFSDNFCMSSRRRGLRSTLPVKLLEDQRRQLSGTPVSLCALAVCVYLYFTWDAAPNSRAAVRQASRWISALLQLKSRAKNPR